MRRLTPGSNSRWTIYPLFTAILGSVILLWIVGLVQTKT